MGKKKVLVAMSGGIDSSLAAALIKSQGYETIGVTLKLFPEMNKNGFSSQKRIKGIESAAEVARKLRIPHYVFDVHEEFEKEIIETFCREYLLGRTPNPCIFCNEKIKFGILLDRARKMGIDYVASGHYARVVYDDIKGRFILKKGKDPQRDQSYFLFSLNQDQLRAVLFPLGEIRKSEVRKRAKEFGLNLSDRPESREICFIPGNNYTNFIKTRFPHIDEVGPIISTQGEVLGEHKGIFSFTIGQRKGLNIAQGYPLYVIALDRNTNTVVVGRKEEVYRNTLTASRINWIGIEALSKPIELKARIRYRHPEGHARVIPLSVGRVKVEFYQPQLAVTSGQAVVFYNGDTVVGGGWID